MRNKKLDSLIDQMENYLECWKQFNQFLNLARAKKFSTEDDTQFLEIKSIIVQELEIILASLEVSTPTKEEIHALVGNAPSLRYLSEMSEGALRNLENLYWLARDSRSTQGAPARRGIKIGLCRPFRERAEKVISGRQGRARAFDQFVIFVL